MFSAPDLALQHVWAVSGHLLWAPWWPYGRDVVGARMYAMADAGVALYVQPTVPELYLPYR